MQILTKKIYFLGHNNMNLKYLVGLSCQMISRCSPYKSAYDRKTNIGRLHYVGSSIQKHSAPVLQLLVGFS